MVVIEGMIEEIIFSNEINGYTVCEIKKGKETITVVGFMPFINVGETLKITGRWVTHPDYGEQLKVELYEKVLPKTTEAIERYLSSGLIKGVGPVTAKKIVDKFKDQTIEIIRHYPKKLAQIKGITPKKAVQIAEIFEEQRELRDVVLFFQEYGISPAYSAKIYKNFGANTIEQIRTNPYRLCDEIFGISFKTADGIAKSIGIDPQSKHRISSGIKYVLSQGAVSGHTFIDEEKLGEYASHLLDVDLDGIEDALVSLVLDKAVYVERGDGGSRIYLNSFYNAELGVSRKLSELSNLKFDGNLDDFDVKIESVQKKEDVVLADKQKEAIREALVSGVLVITGGPGTGKTTIIKSIIRLLEGEGYKFALAAPTGRAAKKMSETTGYEAKTIHRLLEIGYTADDEELIFARDESNPLEADVIIIDEVSMVDILLMNHLLRAVPIGARLILVGDVDQLPSVGAGNVLRDIIESEVIKTVKLTEIFRQAKESMIVVNAHNINKGKKPILNNKDKDFFFVTRRSQGGIVETVVDLCKRRLPQTYGYDPMKHIQVLTPMRKGPSGVSSLNVELQRVLNPKRKDKREKTFGGYIFREGDRVMQIRNNYDLKWKSIVDGKVEGTGVFNGDAGIIRKIDMENQRIKVCFDEERLVEYENAILDELEPAFAITIHKSQGSEFPVVILPVFSGPEVLMTRNLLYTAITRAREMVVLVGVRDYLYAMIENDRETRRNSDLCGKLKKCLLGIGW
ncbi:MAG: ATP-dependent RecD-like DNA helicase [Clostridium sp.]|nr:ATP-dependent RecD-like DNA helicase [Clostridium sp.]